MDILKDYIGFDTAGSESGLYLLSLPGITLDNYKKINSKTPDDSSLWNIIQDRALLKFTTACMAKLNECYRINDVVVVRCLVAEKKQLFATALWYLFGSELMVERIYSDRVNRWTTIDLDEAKQLQAYYVSQFEDELANAVKGICPQESPCVKGCVESNSNIRFVEAEL